MLQQWSELIPGLQTSASNLPFWHFHLNDSKSFWPLTYLTLDIAFSLWTPVLLCFFLVLVSDISIPPFVYCRKWGSIFGPSLSLITSHWRSIIDFCSFFLQIELGSWTPVSSPKTPSRSSSNKYSLKKW